MYFRMLHDEQSGLLSYLLADLSARQAVLVDPLPVDFDVIQAMLSEHQLEPVAVIHTDGHGGGMGTGASTASEFAALPPPMEMNDGELLVFGAQHLRCLATPGHTRQGRSYLWHDRLFIGGLATPWHCPEAPGVEDPAQLWDSLTVRVLRLPAETLLFPGHARDGWTVSNVFSLRRNHPWHCIKSRDEALEAIALAPGQGLDGNTGNAVRPFSMQSLSESVFLPE